jgi:hypothetical protein
VAEKESSDGATSPSAHMACVFSGQWLEISRQTDGLRLKKNELKAGKQAFGMVLAS